MKEGLFGKTLEELCEVAAEFDMPRHAARQIASWLYKRGAVDVGAMTDISAARRAALVRRYGIGLSAPIRETVSIDGAKKYLFRIDRIEPGANDLSASPAAEQIPAAVRPVFIESAMIPDNGRDNERATLCLSSQAGCRMGCAFCATGRQGLQRNLAAGEILNQFASLPERDKLTNIVYMGMGEPLDNLDATLKSLDILTSDWGYGWSPTRITVSTAGVAPALERFLPNTRVNLAVSLHNPFPDEREKIMPVERACPIEKIVESIRRYPLEPQRRVSFEYIVMSGLNDSPRHIAGLTKLLGGLSCRVNLIKFHKVSGSPFFSPPAEKMERFRDALTRKGVRTTIRTSRGEDIEAACGLLSTRKI